MSAKAPVGGSNRVAVFLYDGGITDFTDSSVAGTANGSFFLFDKNEDSTITGDVKIDQIELEMSNKIRNKAFSQLKHDILTDANISVEKQEYEDGSRDTIVNDPSDAKHVVVVHVDGALSSERTVTAFYGVMSSEGISSSRSSGSLGDTPVKFTAMPAPASITIDSAYMDAALATGTTAVLNTGVSITISADSFGVETIESDA